MKTGNAQPKPGETVDMLIAERETVKRSMKEHAKVQMPAPAAKRFKRKQLPDSDNVFVIKDDDGQSFYMNLHLTDTVDKIKAAAADNFEMDQMNMTVYRKEKVEGRIGDSNPYCAYVISGPTKTVSGPASNRALSNVDSDDDKESQTDSIETDDF